MIPTAPDDPPSGARSDSPSDIRHFLDLTDLEDGVLRRLIDRAHARKARRGRLAKGAADPDRPLAGRILVMAFDEPSTRTRLSFDLAMHQMGGRSMILNAGDTQVARGETLADTARVISRFADVAALRTGEHRHLLEFAAHATVPVVNALTAASHPCQIVADLMTFEEHRGRLTGQRIAWMGDGNNVAASFVHAASMIDFELALATPPGFSLPPDMLRNARRRGATISVHASPRDAARGAAAVVTDCWTSMNHDPATARGRADVLSPYRVTEAPMALGDDPLFMHCLPAYRGHEVSPEVMDGPRSVVFDEAENRCHAQKAVLEFCLGVGGPP